LSVVKTINYFVTFILIIGFAMLAFGVFSWVYEVTQSLNLPRYAVVAFLGITLLILGALLGKMFSRVRWS